MHPRYDNDLAASHTPRLIYTNSLTIAAPANTEIAIIAPFFSQQDILRAKSTVGIAENCNMLPGPAWVQFYACDNADVLLTVPQNLGYWIPRIWWRNAGRNDAVSRPIGSRYCTPEFLANAGLVSVDMSGNHIASVSLALLNADTAARLIHLRCEVFA